MSVFVLPGSIFFLFKSSPTGKKGIDPYIRVMSLAAVLLHLICHILSLTKRDNSHYKVVANVVYFSIRQ